MFAQARVEGRPFGVIAKRCADGLPDFFQLRVGRLPDPFREILGGDGFPSMVSWKLLKQRLECYAQTGEQQVAGNRFGLFRYVAPRALFFVGQNGIG